MHQPSATAEIRIALAAVRNRPSVEERLDCLENMIQMAAQQQVALVCFPEAYIPGLRGLDFEVPPPDQERQERALDRIASSARDHGVAVIVGMEWAAIEGVHNLAFVISDDGSIQGSQTKNQIPPSEEPFYVAGDRRQLFDVRGVKFGVTICHEGWRYPESVRWVAERGASIVFHPQLTGSDQTGPALSRWCDPAAPYYEKAMIARSVENSVYFASANYAMRYQESATAIIDPEGKLFAHVPYGEETLLVTDLDLSRATGFYARRLNRTQYAQPSHG